MGVPRLFNIILSKYPNSHSKVTNQDIDYLFVDFNCILYESYEFVKKQENKKNNVEQSIINAMINIIKDMIDIYVKPHKLVYFALDGTPPRAKMIEQRHRRYKKLYGNMILSEIKKKYNNTDKELWDTIYIVPGTNFMKKVSEALNQAILNHTFPKNLEYILSDTTVPGEGEHKFMRFLDILPSSKICIYSNDGDIFMLINRFPQHEIYVLTLPRETSEIATKKYKDERYIYIIKKGIYEGIKSYFQGKGQIEDIMRDYTFIMMLGGNDFMKHIYFLRLKEQHSFRVLLGIYKFLLPKYGHMVNENLKINQKFLLNYLKLLGQQEIKWLKVIGEKLAKTKKPKIEFETWEEEWQHFQHTNYFKQDHPQYDLFKHEFKKINYSAKPFDLKKQYYKYFFDINYQNKKQVNQICFEYLKSWMFCLRYYFDQLPSWSWYYSYHASPLPSDLYQTLLRITDINTKFHFDQGRPFKPYEQLMLILPKENKLLPPELIKIMKKNPAYYPDKFKLDVVWGQKYIYADPILPKINEMNIIKEINKIKLNKKFKDLNKIEINPLYYKL